MLILRVDIARVIVLSAVVLLCLKLRCDQHYRDSMIQQGYIVLSVESHIYCACCDWLLNRGHTSLKIKID